MIPKLIQAGLSASWTVDVPVGLSDYTFQYILQGPEKILVSGVVVGGDIEFNVSSTTTSNWTAGKYIYQLIAALSDDKRLLNSGSIAISPDFENLPAGHDFRSHEEIVLDIIKKALEGRLSKDEQSYQIDGRSVVRIPILELQKLKRHYQMSVNKAKRKQAGLSSFQPKQVKVRFSS